MGCCISSPDSKRIYNDPTDLDEAEEQYVFRTFGKWRSNSNMVPDNIEGLPITLMYRHLAATPSELLYDAEVDQGAPFRCIRPIWLIYLCPFMWVYIGYTGIQEALKNFTCDQACCWVRKEYSNRYYVRIYANRIEVNQPKLRWFGAMGCGSWNTDSITVHEFDRGAFGFRAIPISLHHVGCVYPLYGHVAGRQRCPCNGSLWPRMTSDCGGWWCDEWICTLCCCTYKYTGLADAEEFAFVASIALQAYFEGRMITKEDMDGCISYWRDYICETLVDRRRSACCEESCQVPCYMPGIRCYENCTHCKRQIPRHLTRTRKLEESYTRYENLRSKQVHNFKENYAPRRMATLCQLLVCRRDFGRKGFCFCTEDIDMCCTHKVGDPAPPFSQADIDDENDAARILQAVLGSPPRNVVYKRSDEENSPLMKKTKGSLLLKHSMEPVAHPMY